LVSSERWMLARPCCPGLTSRSSSRREQGRYLWDRVCERPRINRWVKNTKTPTVRRYTMILSIAVAIMRLLNLKLFQPWMVQSWNIILLNSSKTFKKKIIMIIIIITIVLLQNRNNIIMINIIYIHNVNNNNTTNNTIIAGKNKRSTSAHSRTTQLQSCTQKHTHTQAKSLYTFLCKEITVKIRQHGLSILIFQK
jgi:hypothetical protein